MIKSRLTIIVCLLIQIMCFAKEPPYKEVKERFDIMNANSELKIEFNDIIYAQSRKGKINYENTSIQQRRTRLLEHHR